MASLVADYGSSGSDSENDCDIAAITNPVNDARNDHVTRGSNFFQTEDAAEESDDEELEKESLQNDSTSSPVSKLPNPLAEVAKLPSTNLKGGEASSRTSGSVFSNPFQKEEDAKFSILEQHVKMTETESATDAGSKKSQKKICWNYKKGKCRFGQKCKYSHGNDIPLIRAEDQNADVRSNSQAFEHYGNTASDVQRQTLDGADDGDSYMDQAKRKKRPGINDCLQPSKKAMSSLSKQRAEERPWTLPSK